jgi:chorismate mutase
VAASRGRTYEGDIMVRAIRGAIQVDANERGAILAGVTELVTEVMERNRLTTDDVISVIFTATPDLTAEFPALAARKLGFHDVPLICATEIDVPGALPRVVRLMAHVETDRPRQEIQHVYLRGAVALRVDIAQ